MKRLLSLGLVLTLTGCAGANITSQLRESGTTGTAMQTRCVDFSTDSDMNEELEQYDGWRMVYVSEYTTPNKASSAAVMCFEKPSK